MIILPDRNIPRSKVLMPMRLRDYAPSQRTCTFGIENQTRFRLTARLHDGHIAWKGYFDDRDDADAFLAALARHVACGEVIPQEIIRLVSEQDRKCYGLPDWSPLLTEQQAIYQLETLCL